MRNNSNFMVEFVVLVLYLATGDGANLRNKKNSVQGEVQLDPNVNLKWTIVNDDTIEFEMNVYGLGYVGLDISSDGGMTGSDIFIAGVTASGGNYSSDRFATGRETPKIDDRQDWVLLQAREDVGRTIIKFSRLLNTCDDAEDIPIVVGENHVIWAYGSSDAIAYHDNVRRGSSSVDFLVNRNRRRNCEATTTTETTTTTPTTTTPTTTTPTTTTPTTTTPTTTTPTTTTPTTTTPTTTTPTTTTPTTTTPTTTTPTTTTPTTTTPTTTTPTTTTPTTTTPTTTTPTTTTPTTTTPTTTTPTITTPTTTTPTTTTIDPCLSGFRSDGLNNFLRWAFSNYDEFLINNRLDPSPPIIAPTNVNISTSFLQMLGQLRNSVGAGMSKELQVYEISSDFAVPQFRFSILLKQLELRGNYNLSGTVISLYPVFGSGAWSLPDFELEIDLNLVGFAIEDGYINMERFESRNITLTPNYANSQISLEDLVIDEGAENLGKEIFDALTLLIPKALEDAGSHSVLKSIMDYLRFLFTVTPLTEIIGTTPPPCSSGDGTL